MTQIINFGILDVRLTIPELEQAIADAGLQPVHADLYDPVAVRQVIHPGQFPASPTRSKLDAQDVLDIKRRAAAGESYARLAVEYGVSKVQISRIVTGRRWQHLEESA